MAIVTKWEGGKMWRLVTTIPPAEETASEYIHRHQQSEDPEIIRACELIEELLFPSEDSPTD